MTRRRHCCREILALACLVGMTAQAQEAGFELGFRPMVLASQGEPSNDMLGGGLVLSWPWRQGWYFGAALDNMSFDYERPQNVLGIPQDPNLKAIDGSNSFTRLSGHIERRYDRERAWNWFWTVGLGYALVDVDVVTGPTASGGTFNIVTDASDEVHLMSCSPVPWCLSRFITVTHGHATPTPTWCQAGTSSRSLPSAVMPGHCRIFTLPTQVSNRPTRSTNLKAVKVASSKKP